MVIIRSSGAVLAVAASHTISSICVYVDVSFCRIRKYLHL